MVDGAVAPILLDLQQALLDDLIEWSQDAAAANYAVGLRVHAPHDWGSSLVLRRFCTAVADAAAVIFVDGARPSVDVRDQFIASVEEELGRSRWSGVSAIAGGIGLTSGAGIVGWGTFAAGALAPLGLVAGLLAQVLQEPLGMGLERLGFGALRGNPLLRAVARLTAASTAIPVVLVVDHADGLEPAMADALSRLLMRADARALCVTLEHEGSEFGRRLAQSVQTARPRHERVFYEERLTAPDASERAGLLSELLGPLSDDDLRRAVRACPTLGAIGRLSHSPAISGQPAGARSISGLDIAAITSRVSLPPALVALISVLGGSVPTGVLDEISRSAGLGADALAPINVPEWWSKGHPGLTEVDSSIVATAAEQARRLFARPIVESAAAIALGSLSSEVASMNATDVSAHDAQLAEAVVRLSEWTPPTAPVAHAAAVLLRWQRQFGVTASDLSTAIGTLARCDEAALASESVERLRSEINAASPDEFEGLAEQARLDTIGLPAAGPERLAVIADAAARLLTSSSPITRDTARTELRRLAERLGSVAAHDMGAAERSMLLARIAVALSTDSPTAAMSVIDTADPTPETRPLVDAARYAIANKGGWRHPAIESLSRQAKLMSDDLPEHQVEVLAPLFDLLIEAGNRTQAVQVGVDLHRALETQFGPFHEQTLRVQLKVARLLLDADNSRSLQIAAEVRTARAERLGRNDHRSLRALLVMAEAWLRLGELDDALSATDQIIAGAGRASELSLVTRRLRAEVLLKSGQPRTALSEAEVVRAEMSAYASLGDTHPKTLEALKTIGRCHLALRDHTEALEAIQVVAEQLALRPSHGPDNVHTLNARWLVAECLRQMGEIDRSLDESRVVAGLARSNPNLGENHRTTLQARYLEAQCMMSLGQLDEALSVAEDVHARESRAIGLGPDHPNTRKTLWLQGLIMHKIGVAARDSSDDGTAVELLRRAVQVRELLSGGAASEGSRRPKGELAASLLELGALLRARGELSEALALFVRSRGLRQEVWSEDADESAGRELLKATDFVGLASHELGVAAAQRGDVEGAASHLRTAVEMRELVLAGEGSRRRKGELAASLLELGALLRARGELSEALALFVRSRGLRQEAWSEDADESAGRELLNATDFVGLTSHELGLAARKAGEIEHALEQLRRAVEAREVVAAEEPNARRLNELGASLYQLADALAHADRGAALEVFEQAEPHFIRALELGPDAEAVRQNLTRVRQWIWLLRSGPRDAE